MKRALCLIREPLVYRRQAFLTGLQAGGYKISYDLPKPDAEDVLVIWNRYAQYDVIAKQFERAGARVLVVENGYLGKSWLDDTWFAISLGQHNGAGTWHVGGPERWDSLGVELRPWISGGRDRIILEQRGIGSAEVRSPPNWANLVKERIGGRIRAHPGKNPATVEMAQDVADAASVVTWNSGAALVALTLGVPVWYDFPPWIGALAGRPLSEFHGPAKSLSPVKRSDTDRLAMFRRLIWAMWRQSEIVDGTAFRTLLGTEERRAA